VDLSARLCRPRGAYFCRLGISRAKVCHCGMPGCSPCFSLVVHDGYCPLYIRLATRHPAPLQSMETAWRSLLQSSGGPGHHATPRHVTHSRSVEKARRTVADGAEIYRLPLLARSKDRLWRHWCFLADNRHSQAECAAVNSHRRIEEALS
jgi:hypothetical protein